MRRTAGWLAFALVLLVRQATAQARIDERWPLDSGGSVRIVSPFGRLRLLGWDADSLAVSGRLESGTGRFSAPGDTPVRKLDAASRAGLAVHGPRGATVRGESPPA